jgi:DNA-directed RNA polymerase subunit M/transcription elongation factor TFIIS
MTFCPNCGEQLPENAYFCPKCGAKIKQRAELSAERKSSGRVSVRPRDKLMGAFCCILGLGVMLGGFRMVYDYQKIARCTEQTLATITKVESYGEDSELLTVQFVEKNTGNQITTKCMGDLESYWNRIGQQISIRYDPTNPYHAELISSNDVYYVPATLMVLLCSAICVVTGVALMKGFVKSGETS